MVFTPFLHVPAVAAGECLRSKSGYYEAPSGIRKMKALGDGPRNSLDGDHR